MRNVLKDRYKLFALMLFTCVALIFAWTYAFAPFSELANSIILNGATTSAALVAALILTRIALYFQRDEPPFVIWSGFAICLWLWTIAEAYWGYLYTTVGEAPVFSAADILWLLGYIALTVSLARQYRLVFYERKYAVGWAALGVWLAILAGIETFMLAMKSESPLSDFFRYFYLFADTAVGLAALNLVRAFRGRALALPWLTISSFVVTDFLYIHLTETGAYDWVMSGVSIALFADTLYVVAYLIVAWGALGQYLLLKRSVERS